MLPPNAARKGLASLIVAKCAATAATTYVFRAPVSNIVQNRLPLTLMYSRIRPTLYMIRQRRSERKTDGRLRQWSRGSQRPERHVARPRPPQLPLVLRRPGHLAGR